MNWFIFHLGLQWVESERGPLSVGTPHIHSESESIKSYLHFHTYCAINQRAIEWQNDNISHARSSLIYGRLKNEKINLLMIFLYFSLSLMLHRHAQSRTTTSRQQNIQHFHLKYYFSIFRNSSKRANVLLRVPSLFQTTYPSYNMNSLSAQHFPDVFRLHFSTVRSSVLFVLAFYGGEKISSIDDDRTSKSSLRAHTILLEFSRISSLSPDSPSKACPVVFCCFDIFIIINAMLEVKKRQFVCLPWSFIIMIFIWEFLGSLTFDVLFSVAMLFAACSLPPIMTSLRAHSWAIVVWDVSQASSKVSLMPCCDSNNI